MLDDMRYQMKIQMYIQLTFLIFFMLALYNGMMSFYAFDKLEALILKALLDEDVVESTAASTKWCKNESSHLLESSVNIVEKNLNNIEKRSVLYTSSAVKNIDKLRIFIVFTEI